MYTLVYNPKVFNVMYNPTVYTRFEAILEDEKVGFFAFKKFKPWQVRKLKDFNDCCYEQHLEMAEINDGFNNMCKLRVQIEINAAVVCTCSCDALYSTPPNGLHATGIFTCQGTFHTLK